MSLATGISTDNIICMTEKGLQLTEELLTELTEGAQDGEAEPADQHMVSGAADGNACHCRC